MFDTDGFVNKKVLRTQVIERRRRSSLPKFQFKIILIPVILVLGLTALPADWKAPSQVASAYEPPKSKSRQITPATEPARAELRRSGSLEIAPEPQPNPGKVLPAVAHLTNVELSLDLSGKPSTNLIPPTSSLLGDKMAAKDGINNLILYSIDPKLQKYLDGMISKADAKHNAIVVMEPSTGRVLAMSEKSKSMKGLLTHAGFPAASLFKIVTAAAAFDSGSLSKGDIVKYSGGDYTLTKWNYKPDSKKDKRAMSVGEALGKSVNPVFSRVALKYLSVDELRRYTHSFGFNYPLPFNLELPVSMAYIPYGDYELGRTAAGFGDVYISPIHAASIISGVASEGTLHEPSVVDKVVSLNGVTRYEFESRSISNMMRPETAHELLKALQSTTLTGTSRKEFISKNKARLPGISVAAKTGTLTGGTLEGVNNWFVAAAPIEDPKIALAVLTVNPGKPRMTASHMGRLLIEQYLKDK